MIGHTIQGPCQILPLEDGAKQFTIIHPPSQEVFEYIIGPSLAKSIVEDLTMSNEDLQKKHDDEIRAAKARELLQGGPQMEGIR